MAKLPDYTALGERPAPATSSGAASYEPGNPRYVGLAGSEIAQAGKELEDASSIVAATNDRQDEIVARAAGNQLQQASINAEYDPKTGFRNVKGGNALGQQFLQTYSQGLGDQAKAIRDGLLNDNQRRIFDQHAQVASLQFNSALLQHQARETDAFNDATDNNSIDLAMRRAAVDPTNELTFQTALAQANGTVDAMARRKGLPPEAVSEVKAKVLDAAYGTRITSLVQGIPGAVPANPYMAEKMFEQVQGQLGPAAQVHLASVVQKGVQTVQARDTAHAFIYGNGATPPQAIAPGATGQPLQAVLKPVVMQMESGGDPNAVSPKGATSEMQVMAATATDPGYGVRPARLGPDGKPLPGEVARVGNDYLGAMSARYNDPALVLAAYNAGPGRVDQWIAKYGDPRTGAISQQDWATKIPFAETRAYVTNGLQKVATANNGGQPAPISAPTSNQLKTDLYQRVQAARAVAEQQYPGDTAYADGVAARVESYGRQVLADTTARESGARDTLMMGLIGKQQDGSDKPKSIDELLADPQMLSAWNQATPETKLALQTRLAKGDKGFDNESFGVYYALKGAAANDPESFSRLDLGKYFGSIPDTAIHELVQQQASINKKDEAQAARDMNWNKARSTVDDMLKPLSMGRTARPGSVQAKQTEQFYGQLQEAMQQYHDANKKWPDAVTTRQFATGLLADGKQAGGIFWDSAVKNFLSPDQSKFYVPVPSDQAPALTQQFTRAMGRAPSSAELQAFYTKYRLAGGK